MTSKVQQEKTGFYFKEAEEGTARLVIFGRLDEKAVESLWAKINKQLDVSMYPHIVLDLSNVEYADISGISLVLRVRRRQLENGWKISFNGLDPDIQKLILQFDPADFKADYRVRVKKPPIPTEIGQAAVQCWDDIRSLIAYVGEITVGLTRVVLRPDRFRWREFFFIAEKTGANAFPIVALISFLIGLIMAFQAAIPLRMFGAEVFIADLIGLSMTRELGPLMTALMLAGRSGSAFAAELGTMKVNEEIDALITMGLDPLRYLVIPRLVAAVFVTPPLTVFSILIGIVGGAVVSISLGFPVTVYINHIKSSVSCIDFMGGLAKSLIFGMLVAGVGCLRGLKTKTGPSAVGDAATQAVVSSIVLIIIFDGIFSVLYYYLGI